MLSVNNSISNKGVNLQRQEAALVKNPSEPITAIFNSLTSQVSPPTKTQLNKLEVCDLNQLPQGDLDLPVIALPQLQKYINGESITDKSFREAPITIRGVLSPELCKGLIRFCDEERKSSNRRLERYYTRLLMNSKGMFKESVKEIMAIFYDHLKENGIDPSQIVMDFNNGPAMNYYPSASSGLGVHYDISGEDLRKLSDKRIALEELPYITCICYLNTIAEEGGGTTSFFQGQDRAIDISSMKEQFFGDFETCEHGELVGRAKPIEGDLCAFKNYTLSDNKILTRINPHSGDPLNDNHDKYILHFLLKSPTVKTE